MVLYTFRARALSPDERRFPDEQTDYPLLQSPLPAAGGPAADADVRGEGRNPDGLFKQMNSDRHIVMLKMTAIGIDETTQEYYVDESPCFQVNVLTEGVSPDSFTVEYKQNGVYSATPPAQPDTYDVKITRPMDFKSSQLSDTCRSSRSSPAVW